MRLDGFFAEDEVEKLIRDNSTQKDSDGNPAATFLSLVGPLAIVLLQDKKIEFDELISTDTYVPVDRIQKFMRMMYREIEQKLVEGEKLNVVEQMQRRELEFALNNLNKRDMFKANLNKQSEIQYKEIYNKMKQRR